MELDVPFPPGVRTMSILNSSIYLNAYWLRRFERTRAYVLTNCTTSPISQVVAGRYSSQSVILLHYQLGKNASLHC